MDSPQILLVEDDPDDQEIFLETLNRISSNLKCMTANHGKEALNILMNPFPQPSIIFLDLNMPVMNGFEFLIELQQFKELKKIPIIIYSTAKDDYDIKNSEKFGVKKILRKPSNLTDITKIISETLKEHEII